MKLYIRKVFPHDITHEVSVTTSIVRDFFDNKTKGMLFVGERSGQKGTVTINAATDPRFGGDFKAILYKENTAIKANDVIIIKKHPNHYSMSVINERDKLYSTLFELFKGNDRHIVFYTDNSDEYDEPTGTKGLIGDNILFYGVPGSGKSHTVDSMIEGATFERVVFHPDYTYSDFVGQIMPTLVKNENGDDRLTYKFIPGPFTKALKTAINKTAEEGMVYLVIEEINRGNAPAIFGDVFQLLDRDEKGVGKFCVTNYDIAAELYGKENETKPIRIPNNLTILATMNTSDQNVFTLDTAFQRRWNMKYIPNKVNEALHAKHYIDDRKEITWGQFAVCANRMIVEYNSELSSTEDKQLGAYFVRADELNRDQFAEKALKYLWDDVYKMDREEFFNPEIKTIGDMIETYKTEPQTPLKRIMNADAYARMMNMTASNLSEAFDEDNGEIFVSEPVIDNR